MITVSAFKWVPAFAQGHVRDLRVRWALEEANLPYEAELIGLDVKESEGYRAWQPFAQVPAFRDGEIEMFESGAIVLHVAERSEALSPRDAIGRARATTWVLAALNSIEPHVQNLVELNIFHADEAWTIERRPQVEAMLDKRLAALAQQLGDKDYLEGSFTIGDLMMASVLRELVRFGVLGRFPTLDAYRERCEARPAFVKALADQVAPFAANAPRTQSTSAMTPIETSRQQLEPQQHSQANPSRQREPRGACTARFPEARLLSDGTRAGRHCALLRGEPSRDQMPASATCALDAVQWQRQLRHSSDVGPRSYTRIVPAGAVVHPLVMNGGKNARSHEP